MNGESNEQRGTTWLGYALQEGIKHGLTDAREMLAHATPEVLVAQLPRDLTTQLIAGALKTGRLTPESVLEVAPPAQLAQHLDAGVLWQCLSDAAEAANLVSVGGTASAAGKRWMGDILGRGITEGLLSAADVVRHVPPAEWVKDAPPHVLSQMLTAGLSKGTFDPTLALEHLTPEVLAENCSPPLIWKCIAEAAQKQFRLGDARSNASETLEKAAASMSAAKLEAMVVRQSPIVSRPMSDSDSWEGATAIADDIAEEVIEETNPGEMPEPPSPPKKRQSSSGIAAVAAKR
ncbi:MAG: hypothetical protein JWN44_1138 [Myxococcales bacterium]|nr:hypothetical protein [Myxococcales bacterium]